MNSIFRLFRSIYNQTRQMKFPNCSSNIVYFSSASLMFGSYFMAKTVTSQREEKVSKNHINQIKEECISSEKKINDLIKTLENAITETCEKYRTCLKKEVEILDKGKNVDPLDEYWDCLVPFRVEANNLKRDFESYRNMVEYVGQLAFNLAFCSAVISNLDSKDYVCNEYFELEKVAKEQLAQNRKLEQILLNSNIHSIFNTSDTEKDLKNVAENLKKNIQMENETEE